MTKTQIFRINTDTLILYSIDTHFDAFKNIVGKEEIARNEQFLHFPECFLLNQVIVSPSVYIFDIISLFAAELEEPKIGISGKGLIRNAFYPFHCKFQLLNYIHFVICTRFQFLQV